MLYFYRKLESVDIFLMIYTFESLKFCVFDGKLRVLIFFFWKSIDFQLQTHLFSIQVEIQNPRFLFSRLTFLNNVLWEVAHVLLPSSSRPQVIGSRFPPLRILMLYKNYIQIYTRHPIVMFSRLTLWETLELNTALFLFDLGVVFDKVWRAPALQPLP